MRAEDGDVMKNLPDDNHGVRILPEPVPVDPGRVGPDGRRVALCGFRVSFHKVWPAKGPNAKRGRTAIVLVGLVETTRDSKPFGDPDVGYTATEVLLSFDPTLHKAVADDVDALGDLTIQRHLEWLGTLEDDVEREEGAAEREKEANDARLVAVEKFLSEVADAVSRSAAPADRVHALADVFLRYGSGDATIPDAICRTIGVDLLEMADAVRRST